MAGISTPPTPAASAVDEPEMPAKSIDTSTPTCPRPPGRCPTSARDKLISFSVMPALFIRLAASMKNGIASRRNELYDFNISFSNRNGVRRSSMKNTGTQARPSANATGTRTMIRTAKTPKRSAATSAGPMTAVHVELDIVENLFRQKKNPADARERPRNMDRQHVDAGHLRALLVAERGKAPAEGDENQCHQQYRHMNDELADGLAANGLRFRQNVDVEVRAVAHRDGRAEHDQPHQAKARDFLRPDVAGNEFEKTREDLQCYRDHHDRDQHRNEELQSARNQRVERA